MVRLSLAVRHKLHTKQLDGKTAFLNSPLEHEVRVRFPAGYNHSPGHTFSLYINLFMDSGRRPLTGMHYSMCRSCILTRTSFG
mmetsp:Transcript_43392/g.82782  ORF Transcript_43392/g.82782 Transcript_43392/m.82782 type:complete len:83 (-) Transcript_43392:46-294(-)